MGYCLYDFSEHDLASFDGDRLSGGMSSFKVSTC